MKSELFRACDECWGTKTTTSLKRSRGDTVAVTITCTECEGTGKVLNNHGKEMAEIIRMVLREERE